MGLYTELFALGLGLAVVVLFEHLRRKRQRRARLLRQMRTALGGVSD